jgi:hypothetical protein
MKFSMDKLTDRAEVDFDHITSVLSERYSIAVPIQKEIIGMLIKLLGKDSSFDQELFSRDSFCYWFLQQRGKRIQSRLEAVTRVSDSSRIKVLEKLELAHDRWETAEMFAVPSHQVSGFNHEIRESIEIVLGYRGKVLNRLLIDEEFERSNRK